MFIIELEPDMWKAEWSGDPGRTFVKERARKYKTMQGAKIGLALARKYRPLPKAKILAI